MRQSWLTVWVLEVWELLDDQNSSTAAWFISQFLKLHLSRDEWTTGRWGPLAAIVPNYQTKKGA
jgi:hypothetical protein